MVALYLAAGALAGEVPGFLNVCHTLEASDLRRGVPSPNLHKSKQFG